jgi:hypothetical protein
MGRLHLQLRISEKPRARQNRKAVTLMSGLAATATTTSAMQRFNVNPSSEHELYLRLFITCGGGL